MSRIIKTERRKYQGGGCSSHHRRKASVVVLGKKAGAGRDRVRNLMGEGKGEDILPRNELLISEQGLSRSSALWMQTESWLLPAFLPSQML